MLEGSVPIAKYDRKGRIVCPVCTNAMVVPPDRYLGRGPGRCAAGHDYFLNDAVSFAVNDILARQRGQDWRKTLLQSFAEIPEGLVKQDGKSRVILPGHDLFPRKQDGSK